MENFKHLAKVTGWVIGGLVVLVIIGLQPWRPSPEQFREHDPHGYQACAAFEYSDGAGGETYHQNISRAADEGVLSADDDIRDAVDAGTGERDGAPAILNLGDFRSACKSAGYRFD